MLTIIGLLSPIRTQTAHTHYALQRSDQTQVYCVRLVVPTSHKVVWSRRFYNVHSMTSWSGDRRALALMVQDDPNWVNHNGTNFSKLLVWYEGSQSHLLSLHDLYRDWDGVLNLWWSPDKKRLLFRAYYSGGAASDSGQLLCYDLQTQRFHLGPTRVRKATWVNNHLIRYTNMKVVPIRAGASEMKFIAEKHNHFWRCP
jgi:hypothetical protein